MTEQLIMTICHSLPGRLRLRLSLPPSNPKKMISSVKDHEGIKHIIYTESTMSLLVLFDPGYVSQEEIIVRFAAVLSIDYDRMPTLVVTSPAVHEVSNYALASGAVTMTAFIVRLLGTGSNRSILNWMAGGSVGLSVLEHGWSEIKRKGIFDPEVLTLTYLVIAMLKGNLLSGAALTWIASFGRHLFQSPMNAFELRPMGGKANTEQYEMVITPKAYNPNPKSILNIIPALVELTQMGSKGPSIQMINEMKKVVQMHDKVLHGLGHYREGIPLKFN